ncbi:hypothetical protein LSG31_13445 [Fodinisporobacter ferrooxydans]|uniref:DUF2157 domain-containing protein n=1 Tax=Fodinisporobacter ferrooxydans TaxID=2901836 RepID=A0ABY4CM68_9BACL|nr:hypothetical protein LSG31_13445 [Alicyclobacillaceae bacterium MYW30-H2]
MQPHERKIIMREIEKWRESRLLPKEYCDFLLNLYLEGEQTAAQVSVSSHGMVRQHTKPSTAFRKTIWYAVFALVLTGPMIGIILFQNFSFETKLIIMGVMIGILTILTVVLQKPLLRMFSLVAMALLFVAEAYLTDRMFSWPLHSMNGTLIFLIAFCFWVIIGTAGRSKWISGLGLLMCVLFVDWLLLQRNVFTVSYFQQHLFAVGFAMLLSVCASAMIRHQVKTSVVWIFAAVFALFLPDINQWFGGQPLSFASEGLLFLKVLLLTSMGIVWRGHLYRWWNL